MAISDLKGIILSEAKKKVEGIKLESKKEIHELIEETSTQIASHKKDFDLETHKVLEGNEQKIISSADQEIKVQLDTRKRSELESVFDEVHKKLLNLPDTEYRDLVKKLLQDLPKTTEGVLLTTKKRVVSTEQAVSDMGLRLSVESDESIDGGFIIKGSDFEYNYTFKKIIADRKESLEIEVANFLFS